MSDVKQIKFILIAVIVVVLGVMLQHSMQADKKTEDHLVHCVNFPYASDCQDTP